MNNERIDIAIQIIEDRMGTYQPKDNPCYLWSENSEIEIDQSIDRCWKCAEKEANKIEDVFASWEEIERIVV